jgi:hypothetical protein
MHQKFKQLSLMAGGSHYPTINPELQQKFAESIVQECANVLLEWKSEPFPLDPELAAKLIKQHFGMQQ